MPKQKKADSVFYATIISGELIIENILCQMYLPLKLTDSIELHLQPNDEQSKILWDAPFWKFSVEGEIKGYENRTETKITANEVGSSGSTETSSNNIFEAVKRISEDIEKSLNLEAINYAYNKKWISEKDFNFYSDIWRKQKLSPKQMNWKVKINQRILSKIRVARRLAEIAEMFKQPFQTGE